MAQPKKERSNPNQPVSAADTQKALVNAQTETTAASVRDSLPDDVDALKDRLVQLIDQAATANKEITQLQHEAVQNREKIENYPKLEAALENRVKAGDSKIMPLLGYYEEEHGIEVLGAPMGGGTRPRQLMSIVLQNGEYVGFGISSERFSISDNMAGSYLVK